MLLAMVVPKVVCTLHVHDIGVGTALPVLAIVGAANAPIETPRAITAAAIVPRISRRMS